MAGIGDAETTDFVGKTVFAEGNKPYRSNVHIVDAPIIGQSVAETSKQSQKTRVLWSCRDSFSLDQGWAGDSRNIDKEKWSKSDNNNTSTLFTNKNTKNQNQHSSTTRDGFTPDETTNATKVLEESRYRARTTSAREQVNASAKRQAEVFEESRHPDKTETTSACEQVNASAKRQAKVFAESQHQKQNSITQLRCKPHLSIGKNEITGVTLGSKSGKFFADNNSESHSVVRQHQQCVEPVEKVLQGQLFDTNRRVSDAIPGGEGGSGTTEWETTEESICDTARKKRVRCIDEVELVESGRDAVRRRENGVRCIGRGHAQSSRGVTGTGGSSDTYLQTCPQQKSAIVTGTATTRGLVGEEVVSSLGRGPRTAKNGAEAAVPHGNVGGFFGHQSTGEAPTGCTCHSGMLVSRTEMVLGGAPECRRDGPNLGGMAYGEIGSIAGTMASECTRFRVGTEDGFRTYPLHSALDEERCSQHTHEACSRQGDSGGISGAHGQAQIKIGGLPPTTTHSALRSGEGGRGTCTGYASRIQTSLTSRWPHRKQLPPNEEEMSWGINATQVELCDTEQIIHDARDDRLRHLWSTLATMEEPTFVEEKLSQFSVTPADMHKMCNTTLVEKSSADQVDTTVAIVGLALVNWIVTASAKSVGEAAKKRRRFLLWTRLFNEFHNEYKAEMSLLTPEEVIAQVLSGEATSDWASVCFDIKSAFFQHLIPDSFRKWCTFMVDGRRYVFNRLPMGSCISPEIQQRITDFLAKTAAVDGVFVVVHIDNIRFYGKPDDVRKSMSNFLEVCEAYNVTLNEPEFGNGDFLGMEFDYTARTVRLTQRFVKKLLDIDYEHLPSTLEGVQSLFGKLFFAAGVLRLPLYEYYYAIKFYRKLCRTHQVGDERITWWASAAMEVIDWCRAAIKNPVRRHDAPLSETRWTLYTDASDIGYGLVLFGPDGQAYATGDTWARTEFRPWKDAEWLPHINQREVLGVEVGERWLQLLGIRKEDVDLRVDNMTARKSANSDRSNHFWINEVISRMGRGRWRSVEFVKSAMNWADWPSRVPHIFETI